MNASRALLVLMGLILVLIQGLRRSPAVSDQADGVAPEIAAGVSVSDLHDPGPGGSNGSRGTRSSESIPGNPPPTTPPMGDSGSPRASEAGESWPLDSMIQALETAPTPDDLGLWADRIAAHGGRAAVEALIRLGLSQDDPERAEAIREAFKGLSTEEDMGALVERLPEVETPELIEAVVETLARGARASNLQELARLHGADAMPEERRWVLTWAIERVRNPEASIALAELARHTERPELADAAIIAGASLEVQSGTPPPEGSP